MDAFIISFGQDTNGQNARFVEAARKHGKDVMKAFAIGNDDPAGVVARFQSAAERYGGDLRIRSAHRVTHYFEFPADIIWTRSTESQIRTLLREADVVHLNNSYRAVSRFGIRKPMLLHHHGSLFRNNSDQMMATAKNHKMVQAVSTVDLMRPAPEILRWLPSAYDVLTLNRYAEANRRAPDGRIRIVHAPTNRALKHTELFLKVVDRLKKKYAVDLVLVEGKTNAETLAEKAKADIVYDQLMFGYGCNSIEAWAMGVPVVAGADPWTLNQMDSMWGRLPFAEATEATLYGVLAKLVDSRELRSEYAQRGLEHVLKYHDERPALARLLELYDEAIQIRQVTRIQGKGARFIHKRRSMTVDGQQLDFSRGPVLITDQEVIRRLRQIQETRPAFGIQEIEETA